MKKVVRIIIKYLTTVVLLFFIYCLASVMAHRMMVYFDENIPPDTLFFINNELEEEAIMLRDSHMRDFLKTPCYDTSIPLGIDYIYGADDYVTKKENLLYYLVKRDLHTVEKYLDEIIAKGTPERISIDSLLQEIMKK